MQASSDQLNPHNHQYVTELVAGCGENLAILATNSGVTLFSLASSVHEISNNASRWQKPRKDHIRRFRGYTCYANTWRKNITRIHVN